MKKQWLPFILALCLVFAPAVLAAEGRTTGSLANWLGQLVALFIGAELGDEYPPSGLEGSDLPPLGDGFKVESFSEQDLPSGKPADLSTLGEKYPPSDRRPDAPRLGDEYPPSG